MPELSISPSMFQKTLCPQLVWDKVPQNILIIKKINDTSVNDAFVDVVKWLISQNRQIFVEKAILEDSMLITDRFRLLARHLNKLTDDQHQSIDLVLTLGGDGTFLYACSLFQGYIPPVMPFHLGSLGFITRFCIDTFQETITRVFNGDAKITYRSRLMCKILKRNPVTGQEHQQQHLVLNDVVIDRGVHPFLSNVELCINDNYITTLQGDGLIIATPTGSTAYSAAAGASMVHPTVTGMIISPICPHSLSFRPIVVPCDVDIKICIAAESRNSGFVCLDGRHRQELQIGDTLHITTSNFPVPAVCSNDPIQEWFESLTKCLHWNDRDRQKPFQQYK